MADIMAPPPAGILEGAALFLDFDGTLVELAERPDSIRVPSDLRGLLERLANRIGGRIAIVSGRSIADLDRHSGPLEIAVAGSHGLELRLPGRDSTGPPVSPALAAAGLEVARFARSNSGLLVEEKPAGIALHYRQAPELADEVALFAARLAAATGLRLQQGKMVAELLPPGRDKGDAVRLLMKEPSFAGARPLFVGDDLTDEDAFEAAAELGGAGILVGPPRETAARWRLDGVAAVAAWLAAAAED
jgi:trehalose 6-phosphate phosphatase